MKKKLSTIFISIFTLAVLCSCSYSDNEQDSFLEPTSSHLSSSSPQSFVEEETSTEETIFTENQLAFWESEYGKEILVWCEEPNLYTRVLDENTVLYYCGGTVFVKDAEGNIEEVIDQISINPELIRFNGRELRIPFETGNWRYGPGNFPYDLVYNVFDGSSKKEMWVLNASSNYHRVIGNVLTKGEIENVDITNNTASIYFNIDINEQQGQADSFFPQIDYFYNENDKVATLYITGIFDGKEKIKTLENIEGLDNLEIEITKSDGGFEGMKISFLVNSQYRLFCEVLAGYESSPEDHLNIWTEKISE